MPRTRRWAAGAIPLAVVGTLLSCSDLPTHPPGPAGKTVRSLVGCRVEVATGNARCEPLTPAGKPMAKASGNLIADAQWMVETQPGAYTPADSTYRLSVRITNDTETMLGTPDGVQATGLKLFLPVHPMGYTGRQPTDTADPYGMLIPAIQNTNNTVRARNPDGVGSFTAPDQPFWNYPEKLNPWETSGWKEWKFTVDPKVSYFYFAVSVLSYVPGEQPVTSAAPDTWLIPEDSANQLFAPQNLILEHPRETGPYSRYVVMVGFKPTATDAQKQAAISLVGGTLIGGNGAHYYVEVTAGAEPVWTAIDALNKLPQVEQALTFSTGITTTYLRPNNGTGWTRGDWEVHPDSARGANWAFEALSIPSAWGCEKGSSSVKISVVDLLDWHGESVGAIIGNPVNNNVGTAGIMWNHAMTVTNATRGGTAAPGTMMHNFFLDVRLAIRDARVINLSVGASYGSGRLPIVGNASDIQHAASVDSALAFVLHSAEDSTANRPLYVISAGNYQVDALYSGYPQLANDPRVGPRVIVVAAHDSMRSGSNRQLWANSTVDPLEPGSNTGPLPSIAAPGANVNIHVPSGDYTIFGTSFAAPHVAGVAGLLFSQDPSRTAETVRAYLLEGARRGGRKAGTYPIANAYESLKRGAEEQGAPLCGNRVWAEGAQIYARRGSGREAIGPADAGVVSDVLTEHGGRAILYNSTAGGGLALVRQTDGTWKLGTVPSDYNQQLGGATWSEQQYAHFPADSIVEVNDGVVNNNGWWRTGSQVQVPIVLRYLQGTTVQAKTIASLPVPNLPQPELRTCVERTSGGFCTFTQYSGRYWLFRVAYPQAYQPVLVSVTPLRLEVSDSSMPWLPCQRDPSLQCRGVRAEFRWSATKVYRIPLTGGTPQLVDSLPKTVFWMGQTEAPGSDSLSMGSGTWKIENLWDPNTRTFSNTGSVAEGCVIQYRSLGTFATVAQEISNPVTCYWSDLTHAEDHGNGTFSPNRAPAPRGTGSPSGPGEMRIRIEDLMPRGRSSRR